MLTIQISTQTDNHKYRKQAVAKKVYSLENWKFWNPKFNISCKVAFIFHINANPLEFRDQWSHSGTSKNGRIGLWLHALTL